MGTPNGTVHAVYNQAEYPRAELGLRGPIQSESQRTNFGFPWPGPNRWYHKDNFGWPGVFKPWDVYSMTAVLSENDPYSGESFLRMQTMDTIPHPSGLPDYAPLGGEDLAKLLRGV